MLHVAYLHSMNFGWKGWGLKYFGFDWGYKDTLNYVCQYKALFVCWVPLYFCILHLTYGNIHMIHWNTFNSVKHPLFVEWWCRWSTPAALVERFAQCRRHWQLPRVCQLQPYSNPLYLWTFCVCMSLQFCIYVYMCFNISSFSSSSCPVLVNYIQSHKHHIICR